MSKQNIPKHRSLLSVLKSAVRIWFKGTLGDDSNYFHRVFVKDIQKGPGERPATAITKAPFATSSRLRKTD